MATLIVMKASNLTRYSGVRIFLIMVTLLVAPLRGLIRSRGVTNLFNTHSPILPPSHLRCTHRFITKLEASNSGSQERQRGRGIRDRMLERASRSVAEGSANVNSSPNLSQSRAYKTISNKHDQNTQASTTFNDDTSNVRIYYGDEPVRVNKWLAQEGVCSRREAEQLIADGSVIINGTPITSPGHKIANGQSLTILNRGAEQLSAKLTVVLHKPVGFVSGTPEAKQIPAVRLLNSRNQFVPKAAAGVAASTPHVMLDGRKFAPVGYTSTFL